MPQVFVYVRNSDLEKWKAIDKKSEFIHKALNSINDGDISNRMDKEPEFITPIIPGVVKGSDFVPKPPDPEKGYPCCQKRSPCKHWHWDDIQEVWENELTGKTRSE